MKKLTIFTVLLLLFSMFNACEEDEKNLLLGKWGFISVKYVDYENGVKVSEETYYDEDITYLEFLKGGVGHVYFGEVEYEIFTWEKDGKKVTIDSDEEIIIETLNKSLLVFKMSDSFVEGDITYLFEQIYTMAKVD